MKEKRTFELIKSGLLTGLGWAFGVTIGFAFISIIIFTLLDRASIVPVIGNWLASIVENTQSQLELRNPYYQNTIESISPSTSDAEDN